MPSIAIRATINAQVFRSMSGAGCNSAGGFTLGAVIFLRIAGLLLKAAFFFLRYTRIALSFAGEDIVHIVKLRFPCGDLLCLC